MATDLVKKYSYRRHWYKQNKKREYTNHINWIAKHPWWKHYANARQRCVDPNKDNFKYYGGQGIKFLMTPADFKELWFRDRAARMKRPSIDRIKKTGHYIFENCQFIEHSANIAKRNRGC